MAWLATTVLALAFGSGTIGSSSIALDRATARRAPLPFLAEMLTVRRRGMCLHLALRPDHVTFENRIHEFPRQRVSGRETDAIVVTIPGELAGQPV